MSKESREIYEFGPFRLDVREHRFERRDGELRASLPEKAFQTLVLLVRNRGHLVTKVEMLDAIWPDTAVEENNLNKSIHAIRQALEEKSGEQHYIETIPKHGYRFIADVRVIESIEPPTPEKDVPEVKTGDETGGPDDDVRHDEREGESVLIAMPRLTESGAHAIIGLEEWRAAIDLLDVKKDFVQPESAWKSETKDLSLLDGAAPYGFDEKITETSFSRGYLRRMIPFGLAILLIIAGTMGYRLLQSQPPNGRALEQKRLTTGGGVTRVAISPDGQKAAVVQNAAVKVFDLQSGEERVLVPAETEIRILTIAFHPNGSTLYFGKRAVENKPVTLYSIPVGGGEPTKILDDLYGSLSFSPLGKRFAFIRRYPELNEFNLLTADADGSNISKLASSHMPNRFEGGPSWSPDGKTILCPKVNVEGGFHYTLAKIDSTSGMVEMVPNQKWNWLLHLVWLQDSKNVLLTAQGEGEIKAQIWYLNTETGASSKATNDSFVYESLSGSADGRTLVVGKVLQRSHIWTLPNPTQITSGFEKYDGVDGLAWSSDGTLYYHSRASERTAIWQMSPDGSGAKEITPDSGGGFAISPDRRSIVLERNGGGNGGLYVRDLTTGLERSLTPNVMASMPTFMPDGKTVFFTRYDKKLSLWEVPFSGGDIRVVSDEYQAARAPSVSPSGRYIAFAYSKTQPSGIESGIAIMNAESRKVVSTFPIKPGLGSNYERPTIKWSSDETKVYFIWIILSESVSHLASLNLADGEIVIKKHPGLPDGRIFDFDMEPGTDRIALSRGTVERDAAILKVDQPF